MGRPISNSQFAELVGVTVQAVGKAVKRGLVFRGKLGVDPDHPLNRLYAEAQEKKRAKAEQKASKGKVKKVKKPVKKPKTNPNLPIISNIGRSYDAAIDIDDQKKKQETRYKRIQADKAALDYAERLDLMVDDKTLRRKFGIFFDHILNDLVALPDSIADILVNVMESSDDPTMAVADILKQSIKDIIKKGKRAARKVKPPKSGRKYVIRKAD